MRYRYVAYKYTRRMLPDTTIQSLWESFSFLPRPSAMVWSPACDVYETPDELIVVLEIAGVAEEDLSVTLFSDLLVVEGRRKQPMLSDMNACHRLGIQYGEFRSEIRVPHSVDHENVNAEYKNGFLKISLKKLG